MISRRKVIGLSRMWTFLKVRPMASAFAEAADVAQDAALAARSDAETILRNTPVLLTHCSADFRYVFVSEPYARMIGRHAEELAGKKIVDVMGEAGFQTILPHVKAVLAGQRVEYETDVHFKDVGPRIPKCGVRNSGSLLTLKRQ
jgi:PAS domain-containing protein